MVGGGAPHPTTYSLLPLSLTSHATHPHPRLRLPRRRQLLEMLGIPVEVRPSHIEEQRGRGETPVEYAERLARDKARSVKGDLVLGADTVVLLGDDLLEKPADPERCSCDAPEAAGPRPIR